MYSNGTSNSRCSIKFRNYDSVTPVTVVTPVTTTLFVFTSVILTNDFKLFPNPANDLIKLSTQIDNFKVDINPNAKGVPPPPGREPKTRFVLLRDLVGVNKVSALSPLKDISATKSLEE